MKRLRSLVGAVLCAFCLACMAAPALRAGEYQHTLDVEKMKFSWSVDGEKLLVKLSAPTKGWLGIGFNPSSVMKDADLILGYVKDGQVTLSDDFGTSATKHVPDDKAGGHSDVTVIGGTEEGNTTTIEFSIPLQGGTADTTIDPAADTVVLFAYGPGRDSFRLKHMFAKKITVTLGTGATK